LRMRRLGCTGDEPGPWHGRASELNRWAAS
jgi:hypothetical protein